MGNKFKDSFHRNLIGSAKCVYTIVSHESFVCMLACMNLCQKDYVMSFLIKMGGVKNLDSLLWLVCFRLASNKNKSKPIPELKAESWEFWPTTFT